MIHNTCSLSTCLERLLRKDACPALRFLLLQCGYSCCRGLNACRMSPRRRKKAPFSATLGHASSWSYVKHLVGTMRHVDLYKIDQDAWNSSREGISESFIYSGERCSHYFLTLGSVYISAGVIVELGRRSHAWIACSETVTEASPSWHLMLPKKVLGSISSNLNFWGFFFFGNPLRIGELLRIPLKRI